MTMLRSFTSAVMRGPRIVADGIIAALDGLTGVIGRWNDRVEAHWMGRTRLLRAHYDRRTNRLAKPLPVLEAPIDLSMRGGVKEAA